MVGSGRLNGFQTVETECQQERAQGQEVMVTGERAESDHGGAAGTLGLAGGLAAGTVVQEL